jgi:hypothetical protein
MTITFNSATLSRINRELFVLFEDEKKLSEKGLFLLMSSTVFEYFSLPHIAPVLYMYHMACLQCLPLAIICITSLNNFEDFLVGVSEKSVLKS